MNSLICKRCKQNLTERAGAPGNYPDSTRIFHAAGHAHEALDELFHKIRESKHASLYADALAKYATSTPESLF